MAKKKPDTPSPGTAEKGSELRRRAEAQAESFESKSKDFLSPEEVRKALHDLRVHQIELEMQNEELRLAQEALESLRAKYFDLYDLAPVGYLIISQQGLIQEANLTSVTMLGEERGSLVTKPITRFIFKEDRDIYYLHYKNLWETGAPQICELRMARKDGAIFWARVEAVAAQTADGAPACRAVISDLSKVKQKEEQLRHSEAFLGTIIDQSPFAMWVSDEKGTLIRLNQACRNLLHITEEEVLGKYNVLRDDIVERQGFMPLVRGVYERGETARFVLEYHTPDLRQLPIRGEATVVLDVTISPVKDERGRITNAIIQHLDITERRRIESEMKKILETLRESEERYRALFDRSLDLVYVLDFDGRFIDANDAALHRLGYTRKEIRALHISSLLSEDQLPLASQTIREIQETGLQKNLTEFRLRHKNGGEVFVETKGSAVFSKGTPIAIQSIARDISERKKFEEELARERNLLDALMDNIPDQVYFKDEESRFVKISRAQARRFGLSDPAHAAGKTDFDFFDKEHAQPAFEHEREIMRTGRPLIDLEEKETWPDGRSSWVSTTKAPLRDKRGRITGTIGISRDITERKRAEALRQASEARYRLLVENASEAILVAQDEFLKFINRAAVDMTGYSEAELLSRRWMEFVHPDDQDMVFDNHRKRLAGEPVPSRYAFRILTRGGDMLWVEMGAVLIDWEDRPATLNFLTNITDRRKGEEIIQASLKEKEVMLREIHHRVKNNLQVVSSLLNLQAEGLKDENARKALKEGQLRIRSLALVHEKLYRSSDLSKIDFTEYIENLSDHLFHFFNVGNDRIRLETNLDPILLAVNSAVPCGLIFNELMSNALKHAFPEGRPGTVKIGLRREKDASIVLQIADDGVGLPDSIDFHHTASLGLQIVILLVGQLDGKIELDRRNGTEITIVFREEEPKTMS